MRGNDGRQVFDAAQQKTGLLDRFFEIEQSSPRWFKDSNNLWRETKEDFIEFCTQCHRIYDLGNCVVYVQKLDRISEIHFGAQRGTVVSPDQLKPVRDELLSEFDMIFGWVLKQNRGVKRLCQQLGLKFYGVRMYHGHRNDKILTWECYSVARNYSSVDSKSLISF